ncbi:MAG: respiratory nitrate reductase subunit gamma [Desulfovibrio sp.]|jgi:nitrate reductase gamma subunit|nr:respiratory nitrate reductase subunit gamma [Desulfovibrio sp.]
MTTIFYLLAYLAVAGFLCLAFLKVRAYLQASPLHVRWELYPVPHEGAKTSYGGSFMEEKDWWTKPRHVNHFGDIKAIVTEVVLLHATFEHNLKLWFRSYPFHFGMYMLMGGTIIVLLSALACLFGLDPKGGFMIFVGNVINAVVLVGGLCIIGGGVALIHRRMTDEGLRRYTTPEMFFNIGVFVLFGILGIFAWVDATSFFDWARVFICNLLTANFDPQPSNWFALHLLVGFFLLIWIPSTQMAHMFMKYFTYHDIRWGDEPTTYSDNAKNTIPNELKYTVNWSAEHITGGAGSKTWLEVATTNPAAPKTE